MNWKENVLLILVIANKIHRRFWTKSATKSSNDVSSDGKKFGQVYQVKNGFKRRGTWKTQYFWVIKPSKTFFII